MLVSASLPFVTADTFLNHETKAPKTCIFSMTSWSPEFQGDEFAV